MESYQNAVRSFMIAFGQNAPDKLDMENYPFGLRADLVIEEASEFCRACEMQDKVQMIDAICDLLYVTYGAAVAMGVDIDRFFWEVHRSNMSKLDPTTGAPIYRDDGKVLKPSTYSPPDIAGILNSM